VWAVIVDLPAYHEWNPFIVEAAGTVAVGEKLRLRMALPGRSPMTIKPQVLVADPDRELRWKGKLGRAQALGGSNPTPSVFAATLAR
jgi:hypothetical protein